MTTHSTSTIEQLVYLSRKGESLATEELLFRLSAKISGLSYQWVNKLNSMDVEDLQQEASLEVLNAIDTWDESAAPFEAYVHILITNKFKELVNRQNTLKFGKGDQPISLNHPIGVDESDHYTLSDILPDVIDVESTALFNIIVHGLVDTLTADQYEVYLLMSESRTMQEICKTMGITRHKFEQLRSEIREILSPLKDGR